MMMMTNRLGVKYSGCFLVYKAFNPLKHSSLPERKCVSIQGVKKRKTVYISCFYAVQFFFPPFCIVNTTQVSCLYLSASLIFSVIVPRPLSCLVQCKGGGPTVFTLVRGAQHINVLS